MRAQLLLLSLLSIADFQKLTPEENDERLKTCGAGLKLRSTHRRKILHGVPTQVNKAPWTVALEISSPIVGLCSGTLISSRHVITARHCFAQFSDGGYKWTTDETMIGGCGDGSKDVVIEKHSGLKALKVFAGVDCGYQRNCQRQNFTGLSVRKIILPQICDDRQLDNDDFAIVELEHDLEFSETIRAICVVSNESMIFDLKTRTQLFGFGVDPSLGNNSETAGPLRVENVKVDKCFSSIKKAFCTRSLNGKQLACVGDSGGGLVREIDNRVTLIGVLFQGVNCEATTVNEKDYVSNVAFYSDSICEHTGVCTTSNYSKVEEKIVMKTEETVTESSGCKTNFIFAILFLFSISFYP